MRIGVLGTGAMGSALGRSWAARGHRIIFGSRDPEAARHLARSLPGARGGSYRDAAREGQVVVLAVVWAGVREALAQAGELEGKVLIDCTNPRAAGSRSLALGWSISGAEEIAGLARGARVVKAFNHVYAELLLAGARVGGETASVLYCGDDDAAKRDVAALGEDLSFDMVDCGPLHNARLLEPAAMLMVHLVRDRGLAPAEVALKLLRRQPPGGG
jgi:NADPH-dependent F420 reductase